MLVLPTDWSPKKTSLYLARAETGAMAISDLRGSDRVQGRDLARDLSDRSRSRSLVLNSLRLFYYSSISFGAYLYDDDLLAYRERERRGQKETVFCA